MTDLVGLVAGTLVLLTFLMTSMLWLRALAIASNLAFLAYGIQLGLMPIWLLHGILLPVNILRIAEMLAARRRQGGRGGASGDGSGSGSGVGGAR